MIPDRRRAAVVAVGDELLDGTLADSNSRHVAARLLEVGVEVERVVVLGDDAHALEQTFAELCARNALVVVTGGLGPTLDDVTREAAARAAGVPLETDPGALERLRGWFRARGRQMPAANERQARFPLGAQVMPNPLGTAPGFRVWVQGGVLAALPGPPHEMRAMLEDDLVPWFVRTCGEGECFAHRRFHLLGLAESEFADRVGPWMERDANPRMGVTAKSGVLSVTLRAVAATRAAAESLAEERAAAFRERLGAHVFSEDDARPAFAVGRELLRRGWTLATAESCTGGLLSALLTEVPGISAAFLAGFVTYANEAKTAMLGVPAADLERHGAVSSEVARAMALGAAQRSGAQLAVSLTGVAGPGGGTAEKPVGLVWLGIARAGEVRAEERRFPPVDRATVRRFAVHAALDLVRRELR